MTWSPATDPPIDPPNGSLGGLAERLSAAGLRSMIRLAQWKGRREAEKALAHAPDQRFRAFVQINLVRAR